MPELTVADILRKVEPVFSKRPGVLHAQLVGSWSKGTQTPQSDVDFLVDMDTSFSVMDIIELQCELEQVLNREVDIIDKSAISQPFLLKAFSAPTNITILGH